MANSKYFTILILSAAFCNFQCNAINTSEEIIGPKPSPFRQSFNCTNPNLWQTFPSESNSVKAVLDDGNVEFVWKGSTSPEHLAAVSKYVDLDEKRWSQYVKSSEKLEIKRGAKNQIRMKWEINFKEPEFGAMVTPAVIQVGKDGKELGIIELQRIWLPQQMGTVHIHTVGMNFEPAAETVAVIPVLKFTGNPARCILRSVIVEPTAETPKWDPHTRTGARIPEVRYYDDGIRPKPDSAKLSEKEIDDYLAKCSKAKAEIKKVDSDPPRVELWVNGERIPPAIHLATFAGTGSARFGDFDDAGLRIAAVSIKVGPKTDTPAAPGNIWLGKGKYDFEPVKQAIRYVLARAPHSYVMLHLTVDVYNDWGVEHPDDVYTNAKGEKAIGSWSRTTRYGGEGPGPNERWIPSDNSKQFREDGAEFLKALGKWLDTAAEGKVCIGAYLNGGVDGQWLFAADNSVQTPEDQFACFSKGARDNFREFLKEKYKTNEALSKAWGFDVTFDTVEIPAYTVRRKSVPIEYMGVKGESALMGYNCKDMQGADYNIFLSYSNTQRQIAFCKAFKEGCNGRLICGQWWPTLPASYPLAHTDFDAILNSPYVDFISRGGLLGAVFHGKLTVDELDLRDLKSGIEPWNVTEFDVPWIAKSPAEYKRHIVSHVCRPIAGGGGYHLFDMWGGWFWHPDTMKLVKETVQLYDNVKKSPSIGESYVGVFVDEQAANYVQDLGRYYMLNAVENVTASMGTWTFNMVWGRTGLPVRFYLMKDALNPDLIVPKVAIFLNPLTMDLEQAKAIHKRFYNNNRVVVYMQTPGLAAAGDVNNPMKITGFDIHEDPRTKNKPLVTNAIDDALLKNIRPGSMIESWLLEMSYYPNASAVPGKNDKVLANYINTDIPGMLVRRENDHTVVWAGFPGALTPQLIKNVAVEAGMKPWLESDDELIVGGGLLAVSGITGGPQIVNLPDNFEIEKCLSGHKYNIKDGKLTFELGSGDVYGDTAIFSVKEKQKSKAAKGN
jgi:hypothetical protein